MTWGVPLLISYHFASSYCSWNSQCKNTGVVCHSLLQWTTFNITLIQVYAPTSNAEEAEVERYYKDLEDLLELTPPKHVLFIIEDWNAKVGSQEIPGNRKIWPWSTEWSRSMANRVLPRECTGRNKHPLPTTQEKTTHGHHQMVNTEIRLIIYFASKHGEVYYS